MYKAIVRPNLEHCSIIQHPHTVCLHDCLQSVEKFTPYEFSRSSGLHHIVNLFLGWDCFFTISRDCCYDYFCLQNHIQVFFMSNDVFCPSLGHTSKRLNRSIPLLSHSGSTFWFIHSAFPYTVTLWNTLLFDPAVCMSLSHFKLTLKAIYSNRISTLNSIVYVIFNSCTSLVLTVHYE